MYGFTRAPARIYDTCVLYIARYGAAPTLCRLSAWLRRWLTDGSPQLRRPVHTPLLVVRLTPLFCLSSGVSAPSMATPQPCSPRRSSTRHIGGHRRQGRVYSYERDCRVRGLSEIVPTFETVFVLGCHYAISKLCQGMLHHYGVWHVSPRLHIHRFRPWAPVPLPGVCFLTNAHGSPIAHFERFCSPAGWSCGTRA